MFIGSVIMVMLIVVIMWVLVIRGIDTDFVTEFRKKERKKKESHRAV